MDLNNEINRRISILSDFNKRIGVRVEFVGTPNKYYTYLSSEPVEMGLYIKESGSKVDILRVVDSGHDVLYDLDDATLDILKEKGTNFGYKKADGYLHRAHAEIINTAATLNDYTILSSEALIKETLHNKDYDLYIRALREGKSRIDNVLASIVRDMNS